MVGKHEDEFLLTTFSAAFLACPRISRVVAATLIISGHRKETLTTRAGRRRHRHVADCAQ